MLSRTRPRFSPREAERLAREKYHVEAVHLTELPSERDQNFLLKERAGKKLVLKIASSGESPAVLDLQNRALDHVRSRDSTLSVPRLLRTAAGERVSELGDDGGTQFSCRLFEYLPGKPLASVRPRTLRLLHELGRFLGRLDAALDGFSHEAEERYLKWNVRHAADTIGESLELVEAGEKRDLLRSALASFERRVAPLLGSLPEGVIHNDPNDYNVLVDENDGERIAGLLDFGDMVKSLVACDLANACAYAMMGEADPLRAARAVVAGYHEARPLDEAELAVLFPLIMTRLGMSVAISARQYRDEPEKDYLRVSESAAWRLLKELREIPEPFAHYGFRSTCGLPAHPGAAAVSAFLEASAPAPILPWELLDEKLHVLDLSVGSKELPDLALLADTERFTRRLFGGMESAGARVGIGRYDEARPIYTSSAFRKAGRDPRTIHLAIDLFVEAGTELRAPLAGRVHSFAVNDAPLDYGPTIVLEHETDGGDHFYTLYGHLSLDSLEGMTRGRSIDRGESFARVGDYPTNGNWPPHVHFQIVLDLLGKQGDFPGVAPPSEREIWLGLSPDPGPLLGLPDTARAPREDRAPLGRKRRERLSETLSLTYDEPLHIVRGSGAFLYDAEGRSYLDLVNNVCHVGHGHPRVVRALSEQASVLNTNTRYLHRNIVEYAERLASLLPDPLEVCFFVNSGSEANDLALRLARRHTGRRETLVFDGAYHGNLTSLVEVSPYKFYGPGGEGRAAHVHVLDLPDGFRGVHRRSDSGYASRYVEDARERIDAMAASGRSAGALLVEAIPSTAGQIVLPPGYLSELYRAVRAHGGVVIADEVQVGFGRVGSHFWGFSSEEAIPDVVTLGKPIGNGHPLGAVVTTRAIARSFHTGMEYFNTFGGNPVSCAVGLSVLDVIESEGLQEKARLLGDRLLAGLRAIAERHPIVGDVRGRGLFLGFELVRDRETLEPAAEEASYLVNRMKEEGVLTSTDGPLGNVVKIKPPLAVVEADLEDFLEKLDRVLAEDRLRR